MDLVVREPKQKRAVEKKEKIIEAGFHLICENGYYNTNTAEIAEYAGVSTGIVYQYFKDKHDILMEGLEKYGSDLFFPMLKLENSNFNIDNLEKVLKDMIERYINNHKVSKIAHEEITAMIHSDDEVAEYFYQNELAMTETIKNIFLNNNFKDDNLNEKIHIMIGMIDNLCHEIIYHKHESMNYEEMTDIVINNIIYLFRQN